MRARGEAACRPRQYSCHRGVTPMQSAGRSQRLIARAKHHRENSVERLVEPVNRISKSPRMLGDGGGNPGVRQLKQTRRGRRQGRRPPRGRPARSVKRDRRPPQLIRPPPRKRCRDCFQNRLGTTTVYPYDLQRDEGPEVGVTPGPVAPGDRPFRLQRIEAGLLSVAHRRGGGWRGGAGAVALSKPVTKYLSNGATNPIHARYYCGGNST